MFEWYRCPRWSAVLESMACHRNRFVKESLGIAVRHVKVKSTLEHKAEEPWTV